MDFKNTQIIISEVDGVITNGLDAIDTMSNVLFKNYSNKDFEAINLLKPFFTFVFLSSDSTISYGVMRSKNIPSYFTKYKTDNKAIIINKIISRYNVTPENILYIGSKLSDLPCMDVSEISIVPRDAPTELKHRASIIADVDGGAGVICYVHNLLKTNKSQLNS